MPSSPSALLRVELQETGEKLNIWGDDLNTVVELLEEAIAGVQAKALTGNVTLSSTNYVSNEYRHSVLAFTDGGLSSAPTVTVPAVEKNWFVHNKGATYNVNISCGGTAAAVRPGAVSFVYCDGTDCFVSDLTLDKIKAPSASVSLNSQRLVNVADGVDDTDGVNKLQVTSLTSANVALAEDWASKTSAAVEGGEWSAKAHAIGGTGGPPGGNAKDYAAAAAASAGAASTDAATATAQAGIATTKAAEAAASAASANLPAITVSDATKLIKVNAGGTGYDVTTTTIDASGKLITPATATGSAGLNLPHGTAPTSPADGDFWTTSAGFYIRVNGVTIGPLGASSAGLNLISTQTASAVASVAFTSDIDSTYDEYEIRFYGVVPATNSQGLLFRTSADGGASYASASSSYVVQSINAASGSTSFSGLITPTTSVKLSYATSNAAGGVSGVVRIFRPSTANRVVGAFSALGFTGASAFDRNFGDFIRDASAVVDAVRFEFESGNIASGTFRLYGVRKS